MDIKYLELVVTIVAAVVASSGFWFYLNKHADSKDAFKRLLLGLANDRIVFLCLKYIERGEITQNEHETLYNYLYEPYKELRGNGSAEKLMGEVNKLPICKSEYYVERKKIGVLK